MIVGLELEVTETARGLKESARADLAGVLPTGSLKDDKRIQKAIDATRRQPRLRSVARRLVPRRRAATTSFSEEKKA